MLSVLRKYSRTIFIYFIPFLIISFVLYFGWADIRERQERWMLKVNHHTISKEDYRKYYNQLLAYYQKVYRLDLNPDLIEKLGIKQQLADNLINELLLLEAAEKTKASISRLELEKSIEEIPGFQRNGKFDAQLYKEALWQNKLTPKQFEEDQLKGLLISRIKNLITDETKHSEKELEEWFIWEHEKVNLEFLELDPDAFTQVSSPKDQEIRDYYSQHKEKFRVPETVKVGYIKFSPQEFEKEEASPSFEEIENYYKSFSEEFWEPRKVHARHILIKVDQNASEAEKAEAKKKAEEILAQIKGGKPFELMASIYSQDSATNTKGGDLGFFSPGQMIKEFEVAAFSLKPGEVSNIVKTKLGFHIIKVEEIKEEGIKPLEEVKEEIREHLLKERAQERMKNEVYRSYRMLLKTKDIKRLAEEKNLSLVETKYFSREELPMVLANLEEFKEDVFRANLGEIIPPVYTSEGYYIVKVLDKKKSYIPSLEEIKENIVAQLTKEAQKKAARQYGVDLLKKIKQGVSFEEIADQGKLVIKETGFFTRKDDYIPKIGISPELSVAAFTLRPEAPFSGQVFEVGDKIYLIKLKAKESAIDKEDFWGKKEKFGLRYLSEKSNQQLAAWLKNAREQAEVRFNPRVASP